MAVGAVQRGAVWAARARAPCPVSPRGTRAVAVTRGPWPQAETDGLWLDLRDGGRLSCDGKRSAVTFVVRRSKWMGSGSSFGRGYHQLVKEPTIGSIRKIEARASSACFMFAMIRSA